MTYYQYNIERVWGTSFCLPSGITLDNPHVLYVNLFAHRIKKCLPHPVTAVLLTLFTPFSAKEPRNNMATLVPYPRIFIGVQKGSWYFADCIQSSTCIFL